MHRNSCRSIFYFLSTPFPILPMRMPCQKKRFPFLCGKEDLHEALPNICDHRPFKVRFQK